MSEKMRLLAFVKKNSYAQVDNAVDYQTCIVDGLMRHNTKLLSKTARTRRASDGRVLDSS